MSCYLKFQLFCNEANPTPWALVHALYIARETLALHISVGGLPFIKISAHMYIALYASNNSWLLGTVSAVYLTLPCNFSPCEVKQIGWRGHFQCYSWAKNSFVFFCSIYVSSFAGRGELVQDARSHLALLDPVRVETILEIFFC